MITCHAVTGARLRDVTFQWKGWVVGIKKNQHRHKINFFKKGGKRKGWRKQEGE